MESRQTMYIYHTDFPVTATTFMEYDNRLAMISGGENGQFIIWEIPSLEKARSTITERMVVPDLDSAICSLYLTMASP
jgi:hypothetical protein